MASKSRKLRAAIKVVLEPAMAEAGLAVDHPHFPRNWGDTLDLVDARVWKCGGAFIINMARYVAPFIGLCDPPTPSEEAEIAQFPALRRKRLGPIETQPSRNPVLWFKYEKI